MLVTVKVLGFTLGTVGQSNSLYDAWLQPTGNLDFDPTCLRLTHSSVKLHSIHTVPVQDKLYFRPGKLSPGQPRLC